MPQKASLKTIDKSSSKKAVDAHAPENLSTNKLSKSSTLFIYQKKFVQITSILAIISIIAAVFFFFKFIELKQNPTKVIDQQTNDLIARVSKIFLLPQDETPTVATVTDPEKLKDQPFFANAKKGDKVLIYTNAQKAILYDPIENKVIEATTINIGTSPSLNQPPK